MCQNIGTFFLEKRRNLSLTFKMCYAKMEVNFKKREETIKHRYKGELRQKRLGLILFLPYAL